MTAKKTECGAPGSPIAGDEVADLLRELIIEVRGLRGDLTEQRARPTRKAPTKFKDPKVLEKVMPVVEKAMSGIPGFTSGQVATRANTDPALRATLESACDGKIDARKIGAMFARAAGSAHGGSCIQSVKSVREGLLYAFDHAAVVTVKNDLTTAKETNVGARGSMEPKMNARLSAK